MKNNELITKEKKQMIRKEMFREIRRKRQLYYLLIPALLLTIVFRYFSLPGLIMAFQDFKPYDKFLRSEWVGLKNIKLLFGKSGFLSALTNTLTVNLINYITFPAPIILALLINELKNIRFKKIVQTCSYLPHFLSWISVTGIMHSLFGRDGIVNDIRILFGAEERIVFLGINELFPVFLVVVGLWKEVGWGTIIHLANISSINPELYEAAEVDGGTRLQQIWYITLPHMVPMITLLLIFSLGGLFGSNFEYVYGMQNPYIDFEVVSTYLYKTGLVNGDYSMAMAGSIVQGFVAFLLIRCANWISKKVGGYTLW